MLGWMRTRLRVPSLPTAISLLALSIVLTGTAWAATGQLVNIADGTNAARVAKVDAYGALRTVGSVTATPVVPRTQFRVSSYTFEGSATQLTETTAATLALDHVVVAHHGTGELRYDTRVELMIRGASGGTCNGSASSLAVYTLKPNTSVVDPLPVPMLLKPPAGYTQFCVIANTEVVDNPGTYFAPRVSLHGHVVSGTYSGATAAKAAAVDPGAPWPKAGDGSAR